MNNICTSIEQSQKLIELGIDVNTADMFYTLIDQGLYLEVKQGIEPSKDDIPCWSLAALLGVLKNGALDFANSCFRVYSIGVTKYMDNPVDACYEMILKLHELKML